MMRRWRKHRHTVPVEMNITAFMNLMVILVPFLLITAVFTRMTILELNLPTGDQSQQQNLDEHHGLEIIVRSNKIIIMDQGKEVKAIAVQAGKQDTAALNVILKRYKEAAPELNAATILLEPEIEYETLVKVMDSVRVYSKKQLNVVTHYELFPDISIGDAPKLDDGKK